jgi:hypothetical protein
MWYLSEECSNLDDLIFAPPDPKKYHQYLAPGKIYQYSQSLLSYSIPEQWQQLSSKCCALMKDAP